jgi:hypothetical protein
MEISDIKAGKSYACKFKTVELFDKEGSLVDPAESEKADTIRAREGFGVIKTRDAEQQLVEIVEQDTGNSVVVSWEQCWEVDEVEWHDPD